MIYDPISLSRLQSLFVEAKHEANRAWISRLPTQSILSNILMLDLSTADTIDPFEHPHAGCAISLHSERDLMLRVVEFNWETSSRLSPPSNGRLPDWNPSSVPSNHKQTSFYQDDFLYAQNHLLYLDPYHLDDLDSLIRTSFKAAIYNGMLSTIRRLVHILKSPPGFSNGSWLL
jgi:hypothetical protein